ncbi:uncharacterized protein LOC133186307 [Saccostrea echinata]|uniref:uncharacterized protein LOC133186307 n=1 Tax=Saccostrea echinata TaxID=191078 RepID=UPI002A82B183|nr:uncharacterized protein LOC133186307 [Saccostrea echinata]
MGYAHLRHIGKEIVVGKKTTLRVKYNERGNGKQGGMAINFKRHMGDCSDIILHFNPRYPAYQIVLNSFVNQNWQKEVLVGADPTVFSKEFALSLDVIDETTVLIKVQGELLTTYICPDDITKTEFIEFSPEYRIIEENNGHTCSY